MAISPALFGAKEHDAKAKAAKAKSLQVLQPSNGASTSLESPATNIAEQLDEQERSKYVKGEPPSTSSQLLQLLPSY